MEKVLAHSEFNKIVSEAKRSGSLKDAFLEHGITNVENLFPEAQSVNEEPSLIGRDTSWVNDTLSRVRHILFSRVKTTYANITAEEARAKGYIKGKQKAEEVISVLKRSTDPTTIYKLQKMDRDDIIDITDFDVIAWIKNEMRTMLNEEIARAIFIGDGRSLTDNDHINENNVRPILTDDPVYAVHKVLEKTKSQSDDDFTKNFIKEVIKSRKDYKGSGNPVLYTTEDMLTNMLLLEDGYGRTLYQSQEALATALRVSKIVAVPVFDNIGHKDGAISYELLGIMVNLADYTIGADKGGQVSLFDDFDIDYNKQSYLIETRCSGALTIPYSAVTFEKKIDNTVHPVHIKLVRGSDYPDMYVGETMQFGARIEPDNATDKGVVWSSSNSNRATVSDTGFVTAKAPGRVHIYATARDDTICKEKIDIDINNYNKISSIALEKTSISMIKGDHEILKVIVEPNNGINWGYITYQSNNKEVATVKTEPSVAGTLYLYVLAVSAGKANITVKSFEDPTKFATCIVTVAEPAIPATGIILDKSGTVDVNAGKYLRLHATLVPPNADNKSIHWSSTDSTVAEVTDTGLESLVEFKKAGTAIVSAKLVSDPDIVAEVTFNVTDVQATQ